MPVILNLVPRLFFFSSHFSLRSVERHLYYGSSKIIYPSIKWCPPLLLFDEVIVSICSNSELFLAAMRDFSHFDYINFYKLASSIATPDSNILYRIFSSNSCFAISASFIFCSSIIDLWSNMSELLDSICSIV